MSNLGSNNLILKEESKQELGWKSPFEIYFGRKSHILVKEALEEEEADTDHYIIAAPKRKDYQCHLSNVKKLRKRARLYSKRINKIILNRHACLHKTPAYKPGDGVLVCYRPDSRGSIPSKQRIVLKGTIVKKSKRSAMYKVRIVPPTSEREIEKLVFVEDIVYLMSKAEKEKRAKQEKKAKTEATQRKALHSDDTVRSL